MTLLHHDDMQKVVVSDEAGETPVMFHGFRLGPEPQGDATVPVAVFVTGESGFGWPAGGCTVQPLKHLGDGKYGA